MKNSLAYQTWAKSPERLESLRQSMMGHKHLTQESKIKIRKALMGHSVTATTREKQSIAHLGKAVGPNSPNWKGGKHNVGGYELIYFNPKFYVYAHRQVMEQCLGRKLRPEERVHHINHKRKDNRIENLALCSSMSAHGWCETEEAKIFLGQ